MLVNFGLLGFWLVMTSNGDLFCFRGLVWSMEPKFDGKPDMVHEART